MSDCVQHLLSLFNPFRFSPFWSLLILGLISPPLAGLSHAQEEPLAEQLKSVIQHEPFRVNSVVQAGLVYSLDDDDFQGGRTFELYNARLSFRGDLDRNFYYRMYFNLASEPNLLDGFVGYRFGEAMQVTLGSMKPPQTLDYSIGIADTDFVDRAIITGHLVQSREVGLSVDGTLEGFSYFAGLFNGTRLSANDNNQFYGIGRLQYTISNLIPGSLKLGVSGSHGNSPGVRSGNIGPILRGERTVYGGDLRLESKGILFAAEYLAGIVETVDLLDQKETISGYYFTVGYQIVESTMILGRLQSWGYQEADFRDYQFTLGTNYNCTSIISFQFNFDFYYPDNGTNQYALIALVQVAF